MFSVFNIIRTFVYGTFISFADRPGRFTSQYDSPCIHMESCLLGYRSTLPERA